MKHRPWHVHHLPLLRRTFFTLFLSRNLLLNNGHFLHCRRFCRNFGLCFRLSTRPCNGFRYSAPQEAVRGSSTRPTSLFDILHRLGANPGQPSTRLASIFMDIINAPTVSIPASTKILKTCSLSPICSSGIPNAAVGTSARAVAIFSSIGTSRVFLDLDRAALHTVNELTHHCKFFRCDRAIFSLLRQHFFNSRNELQPRWAGAQPVQHHCATSELHRLQLPPVT